MTTQVKVDGDFADVDHWTLEHTFPATMESAALTFPSLWLDRIKHEGRAGGTASVPDVTTAGTRYANRTDHNVSAGVAVTNKYRLHRLTLAAQCAGIAGLVIDGGVRDVDSIVEMGFPAFCRAVSIKGTTKNRPGVVGAPISCGGTPVHPGDVIIGDRDGVVVIPGDRLTAAIDAGIERERKEDGMRAALESGMLTLDLLGLR
ncbi:RraA family protein [Polymorphospora lycopeni]|uniref:Putative 4-hydroxy-4-methyl-2-oxoglutarate aldolase n=1 Tax=Polymorphospora lycopeni TaxID=3140240 RepID=A0ABV5D2F3_9ACTN